MPRSAISIIEIKIVRIPECQGKFVDDIYMSFAWKETFTDMHLLLAHQVSPFLAGIESPSPSNRPLSLSPWVKKLHPPGPDVAKISFSSKVQ